MFLGITFANILICCCRFSFVLTVDVHASDQIGIMKSEILKLNTTVGTLSKDNVLLKQENANISQYVDMLLKDNALLKQQNANTARHLADLQNMMTGIQSKMSTLQAKSAQVVAFTAELQSTKIIGDDQVIGYDHIVTNIGNTYHDGKFTAPVKGLYMFAVTVMSRNGDLGVQLVKDGSELGRAYGTGNAESDSIVAMTLLEVGNIVWVKHLADESNKLIHGDFWNTFSGTLIKSI